MDIYPCSYRPIAYELEGHSSFQDWSRYWDTFLNCFSTKVALGKTWNSCSTFSRVFFTLYFSHVPLWFTLLKISNPCLYQICILLSSFDPYNSRVPFWSAVINAAYPVPGMAMQLVYYASCVLHYSLCCSTCLQCLVNGFFESFFFFPVAAYWAEVFIGLSWKKGIFISLKQIILKPLRCMTSWYFFMQCALFCM